MDQRKALRTILSRARRKREEMERIYNYGTGEDKELLNVSSMRGTSEEEEARLKSTLLILQWRHSSLKRNTWLHSGLRFRNLRMIS
jgi:hypothetical protein